MTEQPRWRQGCLVLKVKCLDGFKINGGYLNN